MGILSKQNKTKMQRTIQMCLAAAVLSVSGAVSIIPDGIEIDTKCEKNAIKQAAERKEECKAIDLLTHAEERMCFEECDPLETEEAGICYEGCIESIKKHKREVCLDFAERHEEELLVHCEGSDYLLEKTKELKKQRNEIRKEQQQWKRDKKAIDARRCVSNKKQRALFVLAECRYTNLLDGTMFDKIDEICYEKYIEHILQAEEGC